MQIYLAGTSVAYPEDNKRLQELFLQGYKLHSYYYCRDGATLHWWWFKMNVHNRVNLFLDSGAFSALTQGIQIDIQEYIAFIKKYEDVLEVYANLDVIGIDGRAPNRETAEKTLENQRIMEAAGLSPIPTFHCGEPMEYLENYVRNYDYISLGGMVGTGANTSLKPWLDRCFGDVICNGKGYPKVKVHGFGVTALDILLRYPWYSVDSSSWVMGSRMGSIYIPRYRNGQWIYDERSLKIFVSSRSPMTKEAGRHITTLSPKQREIFLEYIHSKGYKLGSSRFEKVPQRELAENERWAEKKPKDKTAKRLLEIIEEEGISNRYHLRDEMNIIYFQDLENSMPEWPWAFELDGLRGFVF